MHYENNKINNDEFEEYFKQLDIQLANIEKFGSSLLVIGYFFFIHGNDSACDQREWDRER